MKSKEIALCGLLCALATVMMVLASAIGVGTFIGPVLAMAVLLPVLEEYGGKAMALTYGVTALLAILLTPELEMALVYTAFGWYPLLRPRLNQLPGRFLPLAAKILVGSGVIWLLYGIVLRALGMTADLLKASHLFNLALFILGVFTFLVMDLALARLTLLWRRRFRKRFFKH